jgi:hypothetical protein
LFFLGLKTFKKKQDRNSRYFVVTQNESSS